MIALQKINKLIDSNYSIIPIGDNKVPIGKWKDRQTQPYTKDEFEPLYNRCKGFGIVTGYNNVEVIDIDLKVLKSLKEQQDFWNEYIELLKSNIADFDDKFVIYKTINNGYHILYKCEEIEGNKKLAKLKGMTEAIIETRGVGGYVYVYENQVSKLAYHEIKEISILERQILIEICKMSDYKEDVSKVEVKETYEPDLTPWIDFNNKENIIDIVSNDFEIVKNLSDKYIIRRFGASSPHSGYIYKDSGCMYLFSTGTIYPNETLLNPFQAYAIKNFNGDFSKCASELYKQGYGSRVVKKIELKEAPKINDLSFPLEVFPPEVQNYILESARTLNMSVDYMGCSMLWVISIIIGNSLKIEVKKGWNENCTLWLSLVGNAGIGKTPSINQIIYPLVKSSHREVKKYIKLMEKYQYYMSLDKQEKEHSEEIKKPKKTQFIVDDITTEALVEIHEENKNSIGVFKDELAGWLKDMNKYRAGSDLEFWLSSWSGKPTNMNRKTAKSSFVEKPFISVLGGIQPNIFDVLSTEENKDNGFLDRLLICYPDLTVENYNEEEMEQNLIDWWNDYIVKFYEVVKNKMVKYDVDDEVDPIVCKMSLDAKNEWVRIFNQITGWQNSEEESEFFKSMLPKQKAYIPRFALILNAIDSYTNDTNVMIISKESVLKAEKLSNYFINSAKKVKIDTLEKNNIKKLSLQANSIDVYKRFEAIWESGGEISKSKIAEVLGISRQQVYNYIKKYEQNK
jgi:hypothetical protein